MQLRVSLSDKIYFNFEEKKTEIKKNVAIKFFIISFI